LAFIVALGVLIVFHEFGHYVIRTAFRVRFCVFSIGFGRPCGGLAEAGPDEWVIAALPLAGT